MLKHVGVINKEKKASVAVCKWKLDTEIEKCGLESDGETWGDESDGETWGESRRMQDCHMPDAGVVKAAAIREKWCGNCVIFLLSQLGNILQEAGVK